MDPSGVRSEIEQMSADAAFLFTSGRIREASLSWHGVVQRLLPLVSSDVREAATEAPAAPLRGAFVVLPIASSDDLSSLKLTSEDRTFALYASAIQYIPRRWRGCVAGGRGGLDDELALAATVVYNLGLCHHLEAILNERRAPELSDKALRAYGASQRILEGSGLSVMPPAAGADPAASAAVEHHLRGVCLLQLALTNNAGHVHEQRHSRDGAQHQLEELHFLLASLLGGRPWTVQDETPFVPFLITAVMYPFHHRISLPAPCA